MFLVAVLGVSFPGRCQTVPGVTVPGSVEIEISEFDVPTANAKPLDAFVNNRDGSLWFSAPGANSLGRFDPKPKKFDEFHLRPGSDPYCVVQHSGSGVQTTVYFTSHTGGFIGEFDQKTREVREFRIQGGKLLLHDLSFDPNGAVWFTVGKANPPE